MNQNGKFDGVLRLTAREYEVFRALGRGLTVRQIAQSNGHKVAEVTVYTLLRKINDKTGTKDLRELLCLAARYDERDLKRVPSVPPPAQYKFK